MFKFVGKNSSTGKDKIKEITLYKYGTSVFFTNKYVKYKTLSRIHKRSNKARVQENATIPTGKAIHKTISFIKNNEKDAIISNKTLLV